MGTGAIVTGPNDPISLNQQAFKRTSDSNCEIDSGVINFILESILLVLSLPTMSFFRESHYYLVVLLLFSMTLECCASIDRDCDALLGTDHHRSKTGECRERIFGKKNLANLPIISGAYCFNNGSGLCKAFAGQFEFYFNTIKDKVLGPVEASEYVDSYGFHKRIPRAYNISGSMIYADRSINWARKFTFEPKKLNLLSTLSFNWCAYTKRDLWPYKSAIKDPTGQFHIYFFNRQSCVYNANNVTSRQHYNTRFLHKSNLRIDLDMNPTIFTMQDHKAGNEVRLVKHKRQHWYEIPFQVLENVRPDLRYFVLMGEQREPCIIDQSRGHLFSENSYRDFSDMCLTNMYQKRDWASKNAKLVTTFCGLEEEEIADYNLLLNELTRVNLHNIPRWPASSTAFYGTTTDDERNWIEFAADGYSFSATTTIPIKGDSERIRVIMLYASYHSVPKDRMDEFYPLPYIADFIAIKSGGDWDLSDRDVKQVETKYLNYVDDIAYLPKCDTILVIFGPLYSEFPKDNFNADPSNAQIVKPIYDLGIYEPVNAFTAIDNHLYVFHRTNWVSKHTYECGNPVRAVKAEPYRYNHGQKYFPEIDRLTEHREHALSHSEEAFFKYLDIYKGPISPDAPDTSKYDYKNDDYDSPTGNVTPLSIYIAAGLGTILVMAMCLICLVTLRRRRRRQALTGKSVRSRLSEVGSLSQAPSARSSMSNMGSARGASLTKRSANLSKTSEGLPKSTQSSMRRHSVDSRATTRSNLAGKTRPN